MLVLEAEPDVGGVWRINYEDFALQAPWTTYQFPEFPWPKELQPASDYPSGDEVLAYITAYAEHFGLYQVIRFNTKLLKLRFHAEERTWEVLFCDMADSKFYKVVCDYVVMCTGIFNTPYIPEYQASPMQHVHYVSLRFPALGRAKPGFAPAPAPLSSPLPLMMTVSPMPLFHGRAPPSSSASSCTRSISPTWPSQRGGVS